MAQPVTDIAMANHQFTATPQQGAAADHRQRSLRLDGRKIGGCARGMVGIVIGMLAIIVML